MSVIHFHIFITEHYRHELYQWTSRYVFSHWPPMLDWLATPSRRVTRRWLVGGDPAHFNWQIENPKDGSRSRLQHVITHYKVLGKPTPYAISSSAARLSLQHQSCVTKRTTSCSGGRYLRDHVLPTHFNVDHPCCCRHRSQRSVCQSRLKNCFEKN